MRKQFLKHRNVDPVFVQPYRWTERATTAPTGVDLADPMFWERPMPDRMAEFARLRQLAHPAYFSRPGEPRAGFFALVRHADVIEASRNDAVFSSEPRVTTPEQPRWARFAFGDAMVNMDGERHMSMRRIVSKAFTPRMLNKIEKDIQRTAKEIVDDIVETPPDDFISAVAAQFPTRIICDLMGIPAQHRQVILDRVSQSTEYIGVRSGFRPRLRLPGRGLWAAAGLHRLVTRIGRQRRGTPTNDLISALVNANVEGKHLSSRELGAFFSLLLVAAIETTRNAIGHGLKLLTDYPDQRSLLLSDIDRYIGGAVDEMIRHATPIIQFRRRVTREYEMRGHWFTAGDRVVLFYNSANRDEAVFENPDAFDITRSPNPHVGFGGTGAHFCLGAHLARREIAVLFRELLTRLPDIRAVGEPDLIPSNFDNRIRRLHFEFTGSHQAATGSRG